MATGQHFSTLEVVHQDVGKQVVTEIGIEPVVQQHHTLNPEKIRPALGRKRYWIIAGILLLAMILAAILGGVLGSKKGRSHSSRPISKPQSNLIQRKIAAVSYPTNGGPNMTRLYYQDSAGALIEVALPTSSTPWNFTTIGNVIEKSNSALAAAVSRPDHPLEISIVFTDNNFQLQDIIWNSTTNKWNQGTLSEPKYIAHPNSSLAVFYDQCRNYCAHTRIVVYQDVNGFIQVANLTSSGWAQAQINVKAIAGTGLAMHSQYKAAPSQAGTFNFADQINLYYQKDTLNISLASWKPANINNGVAGWVTENQVYNQGPPATPLAVAASNTNTSSEPSWIQLLQLSEKGIGVNTWDDTRGGWIQPQVHTPSPMSNSTANIRSYGAVAMTALGNAFAVVGSPAEPGNASVESWSMNDDLTDWTSTGTVVKWSD